MKENIKFDYYYGIEADQYTFVKIPRLLIKDLRFKKLSTEAKLLYSLMLDRMSLSIKNGWIDEENRAYIYYTYENIMEDLNCAREKCAKTLAELDSKKGIGLIEKKRQGLGKPDIIYVKNFATLNTDETQEKPENTTDFPEIQKSNFKNYEEKFSGNLKNVFLEERKSNGNYNNNNNTEMIYNNLSINLSENQEMDSIDRMDNTDANTYMNVIKKNIDYDGFIARAAPHDDLLYQELYELICEVVCVPRETVAIEGEKYPYELVRSRYLKLRSEHLQYVMDAMKETTTKISNIKAYLMTALYNAPMTMKHFYQQTVQHDFYGIWGSDVGSQEQRQILDDGSKLSCGYQ